MLATSRLKGSRAACIIISIHFCKPEKQRLSCFASKKTLTEKAGEYEKRGLSLFLALALCLTLLPAAAFADSKSETSAPHTHYLCGNGEACSYVGGHNETDKTTFATAITQNNDGYVRVGNEKQEKAYCCALSKGTYYLATDLILEHPITIAEDITLCLSGNSITINANENAFEVIDTVSTTGATFTLADCKNSGQITHGTTGGTKYLGNGVNLHQSCNFIMYGGSITGNSAARSGGGVCVYGTMTVSGSVRITGNVNGGSKGDDGFYTGGTASNVCLIGRTTITIDGPLAEGSRIGVSLYSSRVFTSGWSTNMSDKEVSSYFIADDSSSTVALENGELKLSNPHTHSWTYTASGATITATCINCAENNNTDFHGGSVTIAAPEAGTPTYDGRPKAAAMTVSNDWLGASANNIRITYKQGGTTLSAAPTNAGTYTAGITVGEGEGAVIASVEYTIAPKELTDPTIEIASGSVYDGNAKTPNVTVKDGENTIDPSEYTVSYDNNVNAGENTATVTITDNANGNYTVWYKVAGDGNHSDTTPESVGVTIAKAKVEIPAADPTRFTYSGEEQTYTLTASGLYTVAGNVRKNAGTHTVTVTLKDAENYVWSDNTATAKTFDFVIAKAPVTVTVNDKSAYTYDAAPDLSKPELDKDYTVSGLIGEDKLTTAPALAYDPATPDMTRTGDAAKIVASGASAGENYEITYVDGKLTVTSRPFSGGGGSSSSGRPSTSTGKTDTTTTTKPDGTVTEITTNKDGSTTKSETKPDGSSKTEVKDASGSTGTVKTDRHGEDRQARPDHGGDHSQQQGR